MFLLQLSALSFFQYSSGYAFSMLSCLHAVPTSARGGCTGCAATQSLHPTLAVGELPDGGREKSRSTVKAQAPLPCNLFPLALVEPCRAVGWLSPCLAPLYIISILVGGDCLRFASCEQNCFPSSTQLGEGRQRGRRRLAVVFSSPQNLQEKELLLLHKVTHHALAWWRGGLEGAVGQKGGTWGSRCLPALGGDQEQRGGFFLLSELRPRVSGTGKGAI